MEGSLSLYIPTQPSLVAMGIVVVDIYGFSFLRDLEDFTWKNIISTTTVPMATKLGRVITLMRSFPQKNLWPRSKSNMSYLHYRNDYDH